MTTVLQQTGDDGEELVRKFCNCPRCNHKGRFRKLTSGFKSVDLICEFCGFVAQVKTKTVRNIDKVPSTILAGAWSVQKERVDAGIVNPLFIVLRNGKDKSKFAIYYLASEHQKVEMFIPRNPLSEKARRAGWQGFYYKFSEEDKLLISRVI